MRINNNVTAMNAHRMYTNNNTAVAKSVTKLSSGYRINTAADDAAGLAISEKMRAQIRGLTMASKNSQDAISLVQTAEGALQETHNILQRMRELAVQSASDTNETTIDRAALNAEFQQLKAEIDDIASKTRFNDQNLIDGTFSSYKFSASTAATYISNVQAGNAKAGTYALSSVIREVGAEAGAIPTFATNIDNSINAKSVTFAPGTSSGTMTDLYNNTFTLKFNEIDDAGKAYFTLEAPDGTNFSGSTAALASTLADGTVAIDFGAEVGIMTVTIANGFTIPTMGDKLAAQQEAAQNIAGIKLTGMGGVAPVKGTLKAYVVLGGEELEVVAGDKELEFRSSGVVISLAAAIKETELAAAGTIASITASTVTVEQKKGQSLVIQTGANEGDSLSINLDRMNTKKLGIYTTGIGTRQEAGKAITYVNAATNIVSTQRAELGALSNRIEHKIANLDTSVENLQAAEGRIRDVDMAKEMTNFTRANILAQASTAMLAQANALPQGVLQLLG